MEERVEVQSCIVQFRGARMTWQQELYRCSSGTLLAQAVVNGAFTRSDGRPVRVPLLMRSLLETVYLPDAAWPRRIDAKFPDRQARSSRRMPPA
jgi:acyl-CoA thioesterase FadM